MCVGVGVEIWTQFKEDTIFYGCDMSQFVEESSFKGLRSEFVCVWDFVSSTLVETHLKPEVWSHMQLITASMH